MPHQEVKGHHHPLDSSRGLVDGILSVMERSLAAGAVTTMQSVSLGVGRRRLIESIRKGTLSLLVLMKVHPKLNVRPVRYVEILERQQRQLVKGIRALYDRQVSPFSSSLASLHRCLLIISYFDG